MRKKLLLLFVGVLCSLGMWADNTYTLRLDNGVDASDVNYFTVNSGGGFNTKYGGKYNGTKFLAALKMNSKSSISFHTNGTATVVIVQATSANPDNQFKFNGNTIANSVGVNTPNAGDSLVRVYTITGVAPGTQTITQDSETGIYFVSVTEASASSPTVKTMPLNAGYALGTPSATPLAVEVNMVDAVNDHLEYQWYINSSNSTSGGIAIVGANSSTYTPDISAVGTQYYYCVIVEKDGNDNPVGNPAITNTCEIKVISSVADPTFIDINGTVEIDCATDIAAIFYSLDNGTTWVEFTRPFTIQDNDATVKAKAVVGGGTLTSEIVSHNVAAVKAKPGSSSIILYYNNTDMTLDVSSDGAAEAALVGNDDTEYQDWAIEITGEGKKILPGSDLAYTTIKASKGRQSRILLPPGYRANRITFYSYVNLPEATNNKNYWAEVDGHTYDNSSIAMASFTDLDDPDVRVFALDDVEDELTFTDNNESQFCYYAVIDYTILEGSITLNPEGFATYSGEKNVYVDGAQAYTCTFSGDKIDAQPIEGNVVPAYNGVLIYGKPGATVKFNYQKTAAALGANDLKPTTTAAGLASIEGALALSGKTFKKYTGNEFLPGKAYLPYNPSAGAKEIFNIFGGDEEEATEVTAVTEVEKVAAAKKYVKNGQFVIENANGVFNAAGAQIK